MPVQIGQPLESDFHKPLGLLSDCHRRIERFLNVLLTISRHVHGGQLNAEQQESLEVALKYFHDAAPLHTCDEEASLFPRMREKSNGKSAVKLAMLDQLHADHSAAGRQHKHVDELANKWLKNGRLTSDEARLLNDLLEDLSRTYVDHILIEERDIFPLAANLLDRAEMKAIAREMASRRGLVFDAETL
jgi:hemerythrin-like domain-containing protein